MELSNTVETFSKKSSAKPRENYRSAFLTNLFNILESGEYAELIGWSKDGTYFELLKPREVAKLIFPKLKKHSNLASFIRQLNMYQFERNLTEKKSKMGYYHPLFQRGRFDLVLKINRLRVFQKKEPQKQSMSFQTNQEQNLKNKKKVKTLGLEQINEKNPFVPSNQSNNQTFDFSRNEYSNEVPISNNIQSTAANNPVDLQPSPLNDQNTRDESSSVDNLLLLIQIATNSPGQLEGSNLPVGLQEFRRLLEEMLGFDQIDDIEIAFPKTDAAFKAGGSSINKESISIITRGIQAFQSKVSEHFLLTENIFREIRLMCASALTSTSLNEALEEFEKIQKLIEQKQHILRENYQSLPEVLARSFLSPQKVTKFLNSVESSSNSAEEETNEFRTQGLNLIKEYKSILNDIKEKNHALNKLYESPPENKDLSNQKNSPTFENQNTKTLDLGLGSNEKQGPSSPLVDQSFHQVLDNIATFMKTWESKANDQTQRLDLINKELNQIKLQMEPYKYVRGMNELLQTIEAQQKDLEVSQQLYSRGATKENTSNFSNKPAKEYSQRALEYYSKDDGNHIKITNAVKNRFHDARKHIESLRQQQTPAKQRYEALKEESLKLIYKTDKDKQHSLNRNFQEKELSATKYDNQKQSPKWDMKKEYQSSDFRKLSDNNSIERKKAERSPWRARKRLADEPEKYYYSDYLRSKSQEEKDEINETRIKKNATNDHRKYINERKEEFLSAKQKYSDHKRRKRTEIHNEISQLDKEIKIITELIHSAAGPKI